MRGRDVEAVFEVDLKRMKQPSKLRLRSLKRGECSRLEEELVQLMKQLWRM